jgi:hypothetical protein
MDGPGAEWDAFPPCRRCGQGDLVPLSDFGSQGAEVRYKAWVCTNPACGFNLKIRNGEVIRGEPIIDGSAGHGSAGRGGPLPKGPVPFPGTDGIGQDGGPPN